MNAHFLTLAQASAQESPPVVPGGGDGPVVAPAAPGTPGTPGAPGAPVSSTGTPGGGTSGQPLGNPQTQPTGLSPWFPLLMLAAVALMFILPARAQKKERKKMEEMLNSLKKGDKVVTVGGIYGTVAELREQEITLKVDDNTRIKFTRGSIQRVVEQKVEPTTGA